MPHEVYPSTASYSPFARPPSRTPLGILGILGIIRLATAIAKALAALEADECIPAIADASSTSHRDPGLFGGWDLGFGTHGVLGRLFCTLATGDEMHRNIAAYCRTRNRLPVAPRSPVRKSRRPDAPALAAGAVERWIETLLLPRNGVRWMMNLVCEGGVLKREVRVRTSRVGG